jgi:hypothetical protein
MSVLTTKQLYVTPPTPSSPPAIPIQFVKPLSYEFRVAEVVDGEGKIQTVKLQMQISEHDEYGTGIVKMFWHDVPRIKLDEFGSAIIS